MPSQSRAAVRTAIALAAPFLLAAGAPRADAAEGRLPVQPGDTIRGTLTRCRDRQVAEFELLQGEVFQFRVRSTNVHNESILVRVLDPRGLPSNDVADVRLVGGQIVAGPFRVARSGTWAFEISTVTAHGAEYEALTSIRRTRATTARLGGRVRGATVAAAAGATIRVRGGKVPALALQRPGETTGVVFAPDSAAMAALRGDGLSAPVSGSYTFSTASRSGPARIRVTPPARRAAQIVEFPDLPVDPNAVASWQTTAGWYVDATRKAPDEAGDTPPLAPPIPATSPFSGSLTDDCPAPGEATVVTHLSVAELFPGPVSGVGLPAAGIPRLDDVVQHARVEETATGPVYVMTRTSAALGEVTTRVRFFVDGRTSRAPLALDGRVVVRWTDEGGPQQLQGSWMLAFDSVRGVQVLDGAESGTPDGVRTTARSATGFALAESPGAWPRGRLALAFKDQRLGADFLRTETYDGAAAVTVDVARGDGTTSSVVHAFPAE